jgi:RNA polymerase sigma-70 factor (ECF subfamily)
MSLLANSGKFGNWICQERDSDLSHMAARSRKIVILAERRRNASEPPSGPLEGISSHLDSLYRTARLLTESEAAAEDLVQETAIRAWRGWTSLRSFASLKPWLLQILHRIFLNTVRAEERRPPFLDVEIDELLSHPLLSVENEESSQDNSLSEDIGAALESLSATFREALWLVEVEELKLSEVAEITGVPVGTVASRVHRARRLLREFLRSHGPGKRGK